MAYPPGCEPIDGHPNYYWRYFQNEQRVQVWGDDREVCKQLTYKLLTRMFPDKQFKEVPV
jgi:hypothetical protein